MDADSWSSDLFGSAEKFARSALRSLLDDDHSVFLLHAATAFEHLSKGSLAALHGSLIAAPDFDSLLHASGEGRHARKPSSQMKTITFGEAVARTQQLVPELANLDNALKLLLQARNCVAHAALVDSTSVEATAVAFLRASQLLLAYAERDPTAFWGDLLPAVDARLTESAEAAAVRATDKLTAARLAFETKFGSYDEVVRKTLVFAIEQGYNVERYHETLAECPACATQALVSGSIEVDWEADWDYSDGESYIAGAYPVVTFFPGSLDCKACGLVLDGDIELQAAGVDRSWRLDDVDPKDFTEEAYWDDPRD